MFGMGPQELLIIGIVAILLFGKRLPEVAKSLGSSYREFRRGLSELQSQVDLSEAMDSAGPSKSYESESAYDEYDDYDDYSNYDETETAAPKFEPPATAPQDSVDIDSPASETSTSDYEETSEPVSDEMSEDISKNISET
jgi:sec-independent protein translocase protein TatA